MTTGRPSLEGGLGPRTVNSTPIVLSKHGNMRTDAISHTSKHLSPTFALLSQRICIRNSKHAALFINGAYPPCHPRGMCALNVLKTVSLSIPGLRDTAIALCYAAMVFAADKGRFALVDGKEQRPPSLR